MSEEPEIEWIECDDPERLAAAAAAGVRVAGESA